LLIYQVQRDGYAGAEPERQDRVRRGLDRPEPVGVHGVHARRRRAGHGQSVRAVRETDQPAQGLPRHGVRRLQPLRRVLPRADDRDGRPLPAGKRDDDNQRRRAGSRPPGRDATTRRPVGRRRRARAQHRPLVEPPQNRQGVRIYDIVILGADQTLISGCRACGS